MSGNGEHDPAAGAGGHGGGHGTPPSEGRALLTFPTDFTIKIVGKRVDGFADTIAAIVLQHAPDFDVSTMGLRPSRHNNYIGLTVTIRAVSRDQLDALYRALSGHPMVRWAL